MLITNIAPVFCITYRFAKNSKGAASTSFLLFFLHFPTQEPRYAVKMQLNAKGSCVSKIVHDSVLY